MKSRFSTFAFATVFATVLSFAASSASAQANAMQDTGWYAGGSLGKARNKLHTDGINANLTGAQDTSGTGFKIFGGYRFNENVAAEVQYHDLKKYSYTESATRYGTASVKGLAISALGILPIDKSFSVFGKVGIASQTLDGFVTDGVSTASVKTTKATPLLGIGGEYAINKQLSIRAEYEYFGVPTLVERGAQQVRFRSDLFSVGLGYRF